jgi:hypothetical protein
MKRVVVLLVKAAIAKSPNENIVWTVLIVAFGKTMNVADLESRRVDVVDMSG